MKFFLGRKAAIVTALCLLAAPFVSGPAAAASNDDGESLETWAGGSHSGSYLAGRFASRQRDYDYASRFFESLLSLDPGNPRLLNRAFLLFVSTGQWPKADELARRIARGQPKNRLARMVLGLSAAANGKFRIAREHFKASAHTPLSELSAAMLMAWARAGERDLAAALKELKRLDKHESFASFKNFHSALIADMLGSPARAEKLYALAWKDVSGSLRITQAYGSFLRRHGKPNKAREVYKGFLSSAPENAIIRAALADLEAGREARPIVRNATDGMAEALFSIASGLTDERNVDIALLYVRMALRMRPDFPIGWMLLGEIYETMGKYAKAIDAYRKVPKDHPLNLAAGIQVALALDDLKRTREAEALLHELIARNPRAYKPLLTLGNILRSHKRWLEAEDAYSRALARMGPPRPRHWTIYYFRGIANERAGRWPQAEADFRLALKLNPDHPSVLNYLGYSLIDRGRNLDEALNMVKKAVEARPGDGYIVDSLGWAYYRLGRYEDAVKQLERAVELRPDDPVINDHLGDAYWRVGRRLEARFQWLHALDFKPEPQDRKRIEHKLKHGLDAAIDGARKNDKTAIGGGNG